MVIWGIYPIGLLEDLCSLVNSGLPCISAWPQRISPMGVWVSLMSHLVVSSEYRPLLCCHHCRYWHSYYHVYRLSSPRLLCHFYCVALHLLDTLDVLQHHLWVPQRTHCNCYCSCWALLLPLLRIHLSESCWFCPAPELSSAGMIVASSSSRCHHLKGPCCLWSMVELGITPFFCFPSAEWSWISAACAPKALWQFWFLLTTSLFLNIIADIYVMPVCARHCGEALRTLTCVIFVTDLGGRNAIIIISTEARNINWLTQGNQ